MHSAGHHGIARPPNACRVASRMRAWALAGACLRLPLAALASCAAMSSSETTATLDKSCLSTSAKTPNLWQPTRVTDDTYVQPQRTLVIARGVPF